MFQIELPGAVIKQYLSLGPGYDTFYFLQKITPMLHNQIKVFATRNSAKSNVNGMVRVYIKIIDSC